LEYHLGVCAIAAKRVGFRGKRVLEVGGSLPAGFVAQELGVGQWTAVEEMEYWKCVDKVEHLEAGPLHAKMLGRLREAGREVLDHPYALLDGAIEDTPTALDGAYDLVFSIACFEHISRLPQALARIRAALRVGGRLLAYFAPIWGALDGHHLPVITDASGREFSFGKSPVPSWGHLWMTPPEMLAYLGERTDRAAAAEMVYYIYHAPHINRLFLEDYYAYFQQSGMRVEAFEGLGGCAIPDEMQAILERRQFPYRNFRYNGVLAILEKTD
jgi:SAM-dependent methyltransferase